jgi:hypothetical protein
VFGESAAVCASTALLEVRTPSQLCRTANGGVLLLKGAMFFPVFTRIKKNCCCILHITKYRGLQCPVQVESRGYSEPIIDKTVVIAVLYTACPTSPRPKWNSVIWQITEKRKEIKLLKITCFRPQMLKCLSIQSRLAYLSLVILRNLKYVTVKQIVSKFSLVADFGRRPAYITHKQLYDSERLGAL